MTATLADIRNGWLSGKTDVLGNHLSDQLDVQVFFDGKYRYTTHAKDYAAMTADNMSTIRTVAVEFDNPVFVAPDQVWVTGRQVFTDPDKVQHTLYLEYHLQQSGNNWYITGFGSSQQPIQLSYRDFRG